MRTAARAAFYTLIFLSAFAGLCVALHALVPLEGIPQVSSKLDHLRAAGGNYDTIFVGSSRIRHHIDPLLFDRLCHEARVETSSFNFGIDAMIFPELPYVVDEILRLKPPRLKRIIMDMNGFRRTFGRGNEEDSIRSVYWHDVPRTWLLMRSLIDDPTGRSISERFDLARRHLAVFARNFSSVGLAQPFLQARRPPRSDSENEGESRGFYPVNSAMAADETETYSTSLVGVLKSNERGVKVDPALILAHRQMAEVLRKRKIHTYYLVSPTTGTLREYTPDPANTFFFDDPRLYPALFDTRNRYNAQHLNASGAQELTRLFAEQFIGRMQRGE